MVRRIVAVGLLATTAFVALAAWAWSSPPGSAPDDDFHMASIWCPDADKAPCHPLDPPRATTEEGVALRLVPLTVYDAGCFRYHLKDTGACESQQELLDGGRLTLGRVNVNLYPGGFYRALHVFASTQVSRSILAMRLTNAALAILFVGAALLVAGRHRRAVALAWMIGLGPLTTFLIVSTNPSSWSLIGLGTLWVFLLALFEAPQWWMRTIAGLGAVASYALAAAARSDAPVLGAAIVVACAVSYLPWRRGPWKTGVAVTLTFLVVAGVQYLGSTASRVVAGGMNAHTAHHQAGGSGVGLLAADIFHLPSFLFELFDNLGWSDTVMPTITVCIFALASVWLMVSGLRVGGRVRWGLILILAAVVVMPLEVQYASRQLAYGAVQPRYVAPLVLVALGMAAVAAYESGWRPTLGRLRVIGAALAIANGYALQQNEARYALGNVRTALSLSGGSWSPAAHVPADAVWIVGTLAGLCALMLAVALIAPRSEQTPSAVPVQA